ncbi:hypothetical protein EKO04_008051 [Ascochyta lentis]|uniref:Uncharacterized protein n=1 Tax=Ascochyta lentis TaxID=205686 RepID=A0A8H7IWC2_9PLEO|nr:hypothetical protein EKO04_008051 [Ascochyta lentis]
MSNPLNYKAPPTQPCSKETTLHLIDPTPWLLLPTYQLRLTLFPTRHSCKTTVLRAPFASPDAANAAALQLAKDWRAEGEAIMLVARDEGDVDVLNWYAVGTWDGTGGRTGRVQQCKWSLMLDCERERLDGHRSGDVSAYVKVVRSWDAEVGDQCGTGVAVEELLEADRWGNPPLGVSGLAPYRFGRYRMRDLRVWRPFVTTTPLDRMRRGDLEDLSGVFASDTLTQRPTHAWHARNLSSTIAGLEENIRTLQQAARQPRDVKTRFDFDRAPLENPADIGWRLAKKSVIARDITMFSKRAEKLRAEKTKLEMEGESRPALERFRTVDESRLEEPDSESEFSAENRPTLARYRTEPEPQPSVLTRSDERISSDDAASLLPTAPAAAAEGDTFLPGLKDSTSAGEGISPIRTNPNECNCNAHRWRRENFPTHKPLPSYELATPEPLDPKLAVQILNPPSWALDPTHMPLRGQHFIPEHTPYPEPTTLQGYLRRQLETTRPVPREAYVRFGVLSEADCETRWGPEWKLQCQSDQMEWDHERNVRRRWRRPGKPRTSEYPVSELDGYEGCLLEHEKP